MNSLNQKLLFLLAAMCLAVNLGMILERRAVAMESTGPMGRYQIACEPGGCITIDTSSGQIAFISVNDGKAGYYHRFGQINK